MALPSVEISHFWDKLYRIDDYRIQCRIEDEKLVVLVVRLGHRRDIYD